MTCSPPPRHRRRLAGHTARARAARPTGARWCVAAHPVWNRDEVAGAVVVERPQPIASLRSEASSGCSRSRSRCSSAPPRCSSATRAGSRTASGACATRRRRDRRARQDRAPRRWLRCGRRDRRPLAQLLQHARAPRQYHAYLESMAGACPRIAHADRGGALLAREPQARGQPEESRTYMSARAGPGAPDHDPAAHERGDAPGAEPALGGARALRPAALVRGCVEGYRSAYRGTPFVLEAPRTRRGVGGADLAAQLLDKLAENAVEFSRAGSRCALRSRRAKAPRCSASRTRTRLPRKCAGGCSTRWCRCAASAGAGPHLGLGCMSRG